MADRSPTLLRRRLAAELQRLRKAAGYTKDEVAKAMEWSPSKMTRIEGARFKQINANDVRAMLQLYGVTDPQEHDAVIELVRESKRRGWLHQYRDVLPEWFQSYVGLEAEATQFQTFEPLLVPGLLQTQDYARMITATGLIDRPQEDIDRSVDARMSRQQLLYDAHRKFWIVLDEGVLRRRIGNAQIMRDQLHRLAETMEQTNVTLQVLPLSAGGYPAMYGPFTILNFSSAEDQDVVYLDFETGSLYLEEPAELERYSLVFNHMRAAALSIERSKAMITQVASETT